MSTTIAIKQIQDDTWNEAIDAAIERVRAGRTITNFAHIPSVVKSTRMVVDGFGIVEAWAFRRQHGGERLGLRGRRGRTRPIMLTRCETVVASGNSNVVERRMLRRSARTSSSCGGPFNR